MNILHKILLGATLCAVCACSQKELFYGEDGTDTGDAGIGSGNTRELLLEFNNTLQTVPGTQTRAGSTPIASDAENQITSMDLYLFGSEEEEGDYTFLEHLAYRSNGAAVEGATSFELIPSAENTAVSTAILNVTKGLYVKLYCVANQPDLFMTPAQDGAYPDATFSKLTLDTESGVGEVTAEGTPTEADFQSKYLLRVLTPQAALLDVPLPMVGNVPGPIDLTNLTESSRLNTSLKLTRAVARFDIVNTATESKLTINSIGMEGGNATTTMFPLVAQPGADGEAISYPEREFTDADDINKGGRLSAYYTYAAPGDACLVLRGKYATQAGESVNVSYKVPFNNIKDDKGVNVAIQPNHRYTVTVNQADPYEVKLTIKVADWEEGGSLDDYDPTEANALNLHAIGLYDDVASTLTYIKHTIRTYNSTDAGLGEGTITFYSNSDVQVWVSYAGGDTSHDWLSFDAPDKQALSSAVAATSGYNYQYTFTAKVKKMADYVYPPATLVFQNAIGALKTLQVHPRELYQGTSSYTTAYRFGHDNKFYLVAHADGTYTTPYTWSKAMTMCREAEGWRLPSFNDLRQLFALYEWEEKPDLTPGTEEYMTAFDNKSYSYNSGTLSASQFGYQGAIGNGSGQNIAFDYNDDYWASDVDPEDGTKGGRFQSVSTSSITFDFVDKNGTYQVRCIKDWN